MTDPRALWQGQASALQTMTPEQVRMASARLAKQTKWRARHVYLAAMIWMPWFVLQAYYSPPLIRWGGVLVLLGGLFTIWEQARHVRENCAAEAVDFLETYRRQLREERDFLSRLQRRSLLPFIPGIVLMLAGMAKLDGSKTLALVNGAGIGLVYIWLWWNGRRVVRGVQNELDAIGSEPVASEKG